MDSHTARQRWKQRDPAGFARTVKNAQYRTKYRLSLDQVEELKARYDGKCWVCKQPPTARGLFVDHDHVTGKFRGMLCANCNTTLGLVKDDAERLKALAAYLESHG